MSDTIETAEELDRLPVGSVVKTADDETIIARTERGWFFSEAGPIERAVDAVWGNEFPVTVLCRPDQPAGRSQREADLDRLVEELVGQRDELEDIADRLAAVIAPAAVLGEHSSANDPWQNALDYDASLRAGTEALAEEWKRRSASDRSEAVNRSGVRYTQLLAEAHVLDEAESRLRALLSADDEAVRG